MVQQIQLISEIVRTLKASVICSVLTQTPLFVPRAGSLTLCRDDWMLTAIPRHMRQHSSQLRSPLRTGRIEVAVNDATKPANPAKFTEKIIILISKVDPNALFNADKNGGSVGIFIGTRDDC